MNASTIATDTLRFLWKLVRLPILAFLVALEPVVQVVCIGVMLLGIFVSIMFEISAAGPRFPFLGMLGASLSFGAFYFAYYAVLAWLITAD